MEKQTNIFSQPNNILETASSKIDNMQNSIKYVQNRTKKIIVKANNIMKRWITRSK